MDINTIKTFLNLAATGNFSRVAERMHLTQSTVSARIKVLEERMNCTLFKRTPSGVILTGPGKRFHHYAVSILQLWEQGQQEVAIPKDFDGVIGIGVHMTLWRRCFPDWISWLKREHPTMGLHVETDYSERLTELVAEGILDVAVTHMPKVLPGLHLEEFFTDPLIMVADRPLQLSEVNNTNYIYVDWSYGYKEEHLEKLPHLHSSPVNVGFGEIALAYILQNQGIAYLPKHDVDSHLSSGQLFVVEGAPQLHRPAYLLFSKQSADQKKIQIAIDGLKATLGYDGLHLSMEAQTSSE